ncbi:MAG TPA: hypothetical protein GX406_05805 [Pseudoclavibacter sp.]|nr:hypothetical protein [Pseudoclavibacter sp.]
MNIEQIRQQLERREPTTAHVYYDGDLAVIARPTKMGGGWSPVVRTQA